jgi:hypothetical protein
VSTGIGLDSSRHIYLTGRFGVVPPTFGTFTPVGFGNGSFFIASLSQSQPYTPSISQRGSSDALATLTLADASASGDTVTPFAITPHGKKAGSASH